MKTPSCRQFYGRIWTSLQGILTTISSMLLAFIKNLLQLSEVMAHGTAHRILNAGLLHTYSP